MPKYLLVALNGPTNGEGDDEQYNQWYDGKHAGDLLSIDGAVSVRRFKVLRQNRVNKPYLSVTEFECDDLEELNRQLAAKAADFEGSKMDRTTSMFVLAEELSTVRP
ncbi:hypothetical protein HNO88_004042 [Novosphingobium chloroacetimidivorans]|uniref:Uncharacterized protein n=1 Tax=Novosphingobium chloroacetimidivorans TaxID=1428314 RepID=A0A7W7KEF6_9SPHN|nr:hypothetical protein [Novosphingobium chloroacetimidivorans]MBB4860698.1 hypothetical protein [Novosphingobium chloroacetimidivorans]